MSFYQPAKEDHQVLSRAATIAQYTYVREPDYGDNNRLVLFLLLGALGKVSENRAHTNRIIDGGLLLPFRLDGRLCYR
jgi:hypothetical protein